jgi:hypothetical protein
VPTARPAPPGASKTVSQREIADEFTPTTLVLLPRPRIRRVLAATSGFVANRDSLMRTRTFPI